jgi:anaerobic magnesium-protoporphyrin IX monomethyl ester cyclase
MKVTLISPRVIDAPIPPLGILYIAAVLEKEGHKVQVFDIYEYEEIHTLKEILKFQPDLIGLSVNTPHINNAKRIAFLLKENLPKTTLVCGGVHVTALPYDSLNELNADYAVVGEGEYTMRDLCNLLESGSSINEIPGLIFKQGENIVKNPCRKLIENLDEIPFPSRHLLNFEWYLSPPGPIRGIWLKRATQIITSRGCPYRCIYCGSNLIFGRKVRRRSVGNVISEIKFLIKTYNIDGLWFVDDTFTLDKEWVLDFCKNLRQNQIKLKWGCQTRVNVLSEELLLEMKKAGCMQLDIGVESGSEKILSVLQKGTTPEQIEKAFSLTRKVGLRTLASFMIGNPEEDLEDINKTLSLAKKIKANYTIFFFTTPFPGTELNELAINNKWIKDFDYSNWMIKQTEVPIMEINFKKEELSNIRSNLQNQFLFRNYASIMQLSYIGNFLLLVLKYPKGVIQGFKKFVKTKRIDDIIYGVIENYRIKIKLLEKGSD